MRQKVLGVLFLKSKIDRQKVLLEISWVQGVRHQWQYCSPSSLQSSHLDFHDATFSCVIPLPLKFSLKHRFGGLVSPLSIFTVNLLQIPVIQHLQCLLNPSIPLLSLPWTWSKLLTCYTPRPPPSPRPQPLSNHLHHCQSNLSKTQIWSNRSPGKEDEWFSSDPKIIFRLHNGPYLLSLIDHPCALHSLLDSKPDELLLVLQSQITYDIL